MSSPLREYGPGSHEARAFCKWRCQARARRHLWRRPWQLVSRTWRLVSKGFPMGPLYGLLNGSGLWAPRFEGGLYWCYNGFLYSFQTRGPYYSDHQIYLGSWGVVAIYQAYKAAVRFPICSLPSCNGPRLKHSRPHRRPVREATGQVVSPFTTTQRL